MDNPEYEKFLLGIADKVGELVAVSENRKRFEQHSCDLGKKHAAYLKAWKRGAKQMPLEPLSRFLSILAYDKDNPDEPLRPKIDEALVYYYFMLATIHDKMRDEGYIPIHNDAYAKQLAKSVWPIIENLCVDRQCIIKDAFNCVKADLTAKTPAESKVTSINHVGKMIPPTVEKKYESPIDPKGNFLQKLHRTAKEVEGRLLLQENKDVFLTKLKTFNDLESKFQSALTKAREAAKADPNLRYYGDEEPEKSESQRYLYKKGWEIEQYNLLEIWPGVFWRRPDEELPSGSEERDRAIEKHWKAAELEPRLQNYKKGPPKKDWLWERRSRKICFWRPMLPFNPSGYLSKFSTSFLVGSPPKDEPPNTETRLVCEYALLAVIYDFALDVDACDRLCSADESWPSQLWENLSNPLTLEDFDNLGMILSMIDTVFRHVKTDLDKLPAETGQETPKKHGRPRKYTISKLKMVRASCDKYYEKLKDKKGAWNKAAKEHNIKSGKAAEMACRRYLKQNK